MTTPAFPEMPAGAMIVLPEEIVLAVNVGPNEIHRGRGAANGLFE